jgi:cell wall-associated NlpC family hydrolase
VATPNAVLTHAHDQFSTVPSTRPRQARRLSRLRSGLLIGATTALTVTALPGTAGAVPGDARTPEQAMQLVAEADHQLEVVTEELNEAKVILERQQAAADAAEQAAAEAEARLDALDGQIRRLARTAYTSHNLTQLGVMLSSSSVDEFVSQLGTLDAIAGHTNDLVAEIAVVSGDAMATEKAAREAAAVAQQTVDEIAIRQKDLQEKIEDFQRQYAELTAAQQEEVSRAHAGAAVPAPSGVIAPSGAAQVAVDTALAQVGDPYVWGAAGPDAFDCSGLTQYAYSAAGVSLPHSSRMQAQMGSPVSVNDLQPGDLLFYYRPTSHVAMYVGNGKMVHASTSGKPVQVVSFDSMSGFTHARRFAG